jgi:TFIIF-interacting CTD phosphatase-like protein
LTLIVNRLLIVLDLDETLVHATATPLDRACEFQCDRYSVYVRPGLPEFLVKLQADFKVGVWTSSSEDYADCIIRKAFPADYPLAFVWSRDRCTIRFDPELQEKYWTKNVLKLKRHGYSLQRTLCVDDTFRKYHQSYGNLILVPEYLGAERDETLHWLLIYLLSLRDTPDVRRVEKRGWLRQIRV